MTMFKVKRGVEAQLPTALSNGTMYFCTDTGNIYIDIGGARKQISAEYAKGLKTDSTTIEFSSIQAALNKLGNIESGANKTVVDSALNSSSTNPVQNKVIKTALDNKVDVVSGKGLSTNDYTNDERSKLAGIAAGAEVNQNAFAGINVLAKDGSSVGSMTADQESDILTFQAGDNVTLGVNEANDKVIISAKDTTYDLASTTADGLMSKEDKSKLAGIAEGAQVGTITEIQANGTLVASSGTANIPAATTSKYGVTRLSSSTTSTSTSKAATSSAVKAAYDLANEAKELADVNAGVLLTKVDAISGKGLSTNDYTTDEKNKLAGISAGAQPNQNAFSTIAVSGQSNVSADNATDVLTLVAGNNITITTDATNDKITIAAANTSYEDATQSVHGLMSTDDKKKLDGIEAGAQVNTVLSVAGKDGAVTLNKSDVGLNNVDNESKATMFTSPTFTGTPKAPTANSGTNTTQIATTAFVQTEINNKLAASDAMIFKGTIGSSGATITTLPATHTTGWSYKVITNDITVSSKKCEIGDMIICIADGTTASDADWVVVQANIDGAVTGPNSSVNNRVAVFSGTTGKVIKDSGYTIAKSVPSDAKFTDTTYTETTDTKAGLFTPAEKAKLAGIAEGANNYTYTLPAAGTSLGGVKSGGDVTISDGLIQVKDNSHNHSVSTITGLDDNYVSKEGYNNHTHKVTHTPKGTVSQPTFSGSTSTTNAGDTTNVVSAALASHKHTFTPAGTITNTKFTGTAATIGSISGTGTASKSTHTHKVALSGNLAAPTFTGTAATIPKTSTAAATVASSTHTHTVSSVTGTVSKPTFTGNENTTSTPSTGASVSKISSAGSLQTLSGSVSNRCLTLSLTGGSVVSYTDVVVANSEHTHTVTPTGSVSQPTFSNGAATIGQASGTATVAATGHTHAYTPEGTISAVALSGTMTAAASSDTIGVSTSTHTHAYTPAGSVSASFSGTAGTVNVTDDDSVENVSTSAHTHAFKAAGTVSQPTFTGTQETISSTTPQ